MKLAKAWEDAFFTSSTPSTRKVALRISLVIGKNEGVLLVLKRLTKRGFGGQHGNGKQKFAWIHIADLISIIDFIETNIEREGSINCTADFVTEHYWGYTKINNAKTNEYEVKHPAWKIYNILDSVIDVDFGANYGFEFLKNEKPQSVMLAEGSEISVGNKRVL